MHVKLKNRDDIVSSLRKIDEFINLSGNETLFDFNGHPIITQNKNHILYDYFIRSKGLDKMLSGIIIDSFSFMEKNGPGSSLFSWNILSSIVKEKNVSRTYENLINFCKSNNLNASKKEFKIILDSFINDKKIKSMLWESLDLCGYQGRMFIDPNNNSESSISLNLGYSFDVIVPISLSNSQVKVDSKFICIDGVIEKVSEIHHILEQNSMRKDPIFIVARGFSDEVLSTLVVNLKRKTLNVIPIQIPFDPQKMNYVTDISIVTKSEIISPSMGKLLSSIKLDNIETVDYVHLSNGFLLIENKKSFNDVLNHINHLYNRIDEDPNSHILIDNRIKNLSSRRLNIKLNHKNDHEKRSNNNDLDLGMRINKSLTKFGYIDITKINLRSLNNFEKIVITSLLKLNITLLPTMTLIFLLKNLSSLKNSIDDIYISIEKDRV